jgi:pimeloyl-ACP methyl ester carboxylesterase
VSSKLYSPPVTHEVIGRDGRALRYCLYGPDTGTPVVAHGGSPSTRWKWPFIVEAIEDSGIRLLAYDRPGFGGSTRHVGRRVADAADDVRMLADGQGWDRFAVMGGSGGGPHALACAALMPERVTRCAIASGIMPPDVSDLDRSDLRPGSRLAALGEHVLRPYLEEVSRGIMAQIDAGGPEILPDPGALPPDPADAPGRALDDAAAMARLRATFVEGMDGWVDDGIAYVHPWGFAMDSITVPVGIWYGTHDTNTPPTHAAWLLSRAPTAEDHRYVGGHLPDAGVYREIYAWLHA